jgi:superfamily II DNA helicase RecQ
MPSTYEVEAALRERFGFSGFRAGQRELIEAALAGRDALGILPTGGGKSLTYQLPATMRDGLTVVVSPLIALMKDQVDAFNRRGLGRAVAIHSISRPERRRGARAGRSGTAAPLSCAGAPGDRNGGSPAGEPRRACWSSTRRTVSQWG